MQQSETTCRICGNPFGNHRPECEVAFRDKLNPNPVIQAQHEKMDEGYDHAMIAPEKFKQLVAGEGDGVFSVGGLICRADANTKARLFVRSPGTDEIWSYVGDQSDGTEKVMDAVYTTLWDDVELLLQGNQGTVEFSADFRVRQMTDEEIAKLPEM